MNVSGQPLALYWAEGVVFLADFVEPEALPEEYVKGRIYASNISHAPMPKYNNFVRVGNIEVPVIDVTSNRIRQRPDLRLQHIPRTDAKIQQLRPRWKHRSPSNRRNLQHRPTRPSPLDKRKPAAGFREILTRRLGSRLGRVPG